MKYLKCAFLAFLALMLCACASRKFKAPSCHGSYERINAPERYLKDAGRE